MYDTDLIDPALRSGGDDSFQFDPQGMTVGISFFQGHGANFDQGQNYPCNSSSWSQSCSLATPPSGGTGLGCAVTPNSENQYGMGYGLCRWNIPNKIPAMLTCGSGDTPYHGAFVGANEVAFGENTVSGAWRGAGADGGVGLVFIKHSFGMWLPFASDWWPAFAGMDLYAGVAVGWGDSEDVSQYGYAVASPYSQNPYGDIKDSYLSAMNNISQGGGCNHSYGGTSWPGGIGGCGCHAIMTMSSNASVGQDIIGFEDWSELQGGAYTAWQSGKQYWYWAVNCNWNPGTGGWYGGP